jgi:hypothetical protein
MISAPHLASSLGAAADNQHKTLPLQTLWSDTESVLLHYFFEAGKMANRSEKKQ